MKNQFSRLLYFKIQTVRLNQLSIQFLLNSNTKMKETKSKKWSQRSEAYKQRHNKKKSWSQRSEAYKQRHNKKKSWSQRSEAHKQRHNKKKRWSQRTEAYKQRQNKKKSWSQRSEGYKQRHKEKKRLKRKVNLKKKNMSKVTSARLLGEQLYEEIEKNQKGEKVETLI